VSHTKFHLNQRAPIHEEYFKGAFSSHPILLSPILLSSSVSPYFLRAYVMEVALSQYPVLQGVVPHISTEDLFYLSCVGENAEETCLKELQRRRKNTPTSVYYSGLIDTEFLNLQPCDELTVTLPVASSEIDYRVLFRSVRNWQTPRVMRVIIAGRVPSRLQRFLRPRFLPWTDLIIPVSQVFKIRDNFTRLTTLALTSTRNRRISLPNLVSQALIQSHLWIQSVQ